MVSGAAATGVTATMLSLRGCGNAIVVSVAGVVSVTLAGGSSSLMMRVVASSALGEGAADTALSGRALSAAPGAVVPGGAVLAGPGWPVSGWPVSGWPVSGWPV